MPSVFRPSRRDPNRSLQPARCAWLTATACLILTGLFLSLDKQFAKGEQTQPTIRNVPYDGGRVLGNRRKLDVYGLRDGTQHPVLIWIHGGAWQFGNKFAVQRKPEFFRELGFVLVSVEYRMVPDVTFREQASDIATAIRWVTNHIERYGGDAKRIYLMGHSAGAHLAALVSCDARYLASQQLSLSHVSGTILLDGAGYDIPRQVREAPRAISRAMYEKAFGTDPKQQAEASPITHVVEGSSYPPFLIIHVADRVDSRNQAHGLAEKLKSVGGKARVVAASGKTHGTLNRELGQPNDEPSRQVARFLEKLEDRQQQKVRNSSSVESSDDQ